jgi:hypothetical protein
MKLQAYPKTSHISVNPSSQGDPTVPLSEEDVFNMCYVVEGVSVGSTYLLFNATTPDGQVISSKPKEIQVFAPLKLLPEIVTLLPTAVFQVQEWGGTEGGTDGGRGREEGGREKGRTDGRREGGRGGREGGVTLIHFHHPFFVPCEAVFVHFHSRSRAVVVQSLRSPFSIPSPTRMSLTLATLA